MTRGRLSTKQRQALWDRECAKTGAFPQCNLCLLPVRPGQAWEESHFPIPHAFDGKETGIAHKRCNHQHGAKIVTPMVAKSKRVRARFVGAFRSSRPLPCGRGSRLSKKISGEVVARKSQSEKLAETLARRGTMRRSSDETTTGNIAGRRTALAGTSGRSKHDRRINEPS